jgi:hypothetical protein
VAALLDAGFGYFVWMTHLVVVYVATAVGCQLGLGRASAGTRTTFLLVLALVTVVAVAAAVVHAIQRYRRFRAVPDRRFRMWVTVGGDAIACVAIGWQLIPILLVPVCT